MKTSFDATISVPKEDGTTEMEEDVEVCVKADFNPPIKPRIGSCPDYDDPGDPGELTIISITRYDTDEDITDKVDHDQFWDRVLDEAEREDEYARESAAEARAEIRAEREEYGDDDYD